MPACAPVSSEPGTTKPFRLNGVKASLPINLAKALERGNAVGCALSVRR